MQSHLFFSTITPYSQTRIKQTHRAAVRRKVSFIHSYFYQLSCQRRKFVLNKSKEVKTFLMSKCFFYPCFFYPSSTIALFRNRKTFSTTFVQSNLFSPNLSIKTSNFSKTKKLSHNWSKSDRMTIEW